ncbi:MAG: hypothetical protein IT208_03755 [Chthonomonadales bacterium]|nr:hypothetical protein [Chthonomonadales bacterium]
MRGKGPTIPPALVVAIVVVVLGVIGFTYWWRLRPPTGLPPAEFNRRYQQMWDARTKQEPYRPPGGAAAPTTPPPASELNRRWMGGSTGGAANPGTPAPR